MDKIDRIYRLHQYFKQRRTPVDVQALIDEFECDRSTIMRDINWLKNFMGAPLANKRGEGYYYDRQQDSFELPGLWLTANELQSLVAFNHLMQKLQPGILSDLLEPFKTRMDEILSLRELSGAQTITDRVKILPQNSRDVESGIYHSVVEALTSHHQMMTTYHARNGSEPQTRLLSPLQLIHYRDNWYLDAWCHEREGLRTFSLDRFISIQLLKTPAIEVDTDQLRQYYATAYGIFAGAASETAVLKFNTYAAQWVADESWHPEQVGRWTDDGYYEVTIPYHESPELIGEILRWIPHVKVVSPSSLKDKVRQRVADYLAAE
jgi:predicted DNA-binding transcriptional regulator YafY